MQTDTADFGPNGGLYKNSVAVVARNWTQPVMDYRATMTTTPNDEAINLGGSHTPSGQNMNTLLSDMLGWTQTYLEATHLYVSYKDFNLNPDPPFDIFWNTQGAPPNNYPTIFSWILAGQSVTTTCPSNFTGGCDTSN